jgi:hypothetical protein
MGVLTSRKDRSCADVAPALRVAGSGDTLREARRAKDPRRLDRREPTPWAASPPDTAGVACLEAEPRRAVRHFGRLSSAWEHSTLWDSAQLKAEVEIRVSIDVVEPYEEATKEMFR